MEYTVAHLQQAERLSPLAKCETRSVSGSIDKPQNAGKDGEVHYLHFFTLRAVVILSRRSLSLDVQILPVGMQAGGEELG